jgi:hypothetical protein
MWGDLIFRGLKSTATLGSRYATLGSQSYYRKSLPVDRVEVKGR